MRAILSALRPETTPAHTRDHIAQRGQRVERQSAPWTALSTDCTAHRRWMELETDTLYKVQCSDIYSELCVAVRRDVASVAASTELGAFLPPPGVGLAYVHVRRVYVARKSGVGPPRPSSALFVTESNMGNAYFRVRRTRSARQVNDFFTPRVHSHSAYSSQYAI